MAKRSVDAENRTLIVSTLEMIEGVLSENQSRGQIDIMADRGYNRRSVLGGFIAELLAEAKKRGMDPEKIIRHALWQTDMYYHRGCWKNERLQALAEEYIGDQDAKPDPADLR